MKNTLYIIGTGGFAKEVAQLATLLNSNGARWSSIEYLCEREEDIGTRMPYGAVTGTDERLQSNHCAAEYVIGIGNPIVRQRIAQRLAKNLLLFSPNLIHPLAGFSTVSVELGQGNIITQGVVFTCDIVAGDHNVFNLNSTVGHDCHIGSYNVINPGCNISGGVTLGNSCLLGTGSRILESLQVADEVILGAGALLTRSINNSGDTYVGIPARPLKRI